MKHASVNMNDALCLRNRRGRNEGKMILTIVEQFGTGVREEVGV